MKRITLQEFRCFENLTVDFKPGINLLIGDNGSGKTLLLQACKYALSSFFSGFSDVNTKWLSPGSDDYFIRVANEDTVVESQKTCRKSQCCCKSLAQRDDKEELEKSRDRR